MLVVIVILLTWTTAAVVQTQSTSCRTVDGQTGSCTPIKDCAPLHTLAQKRGQTAEEISYLRKSACGFTPDGQPKVCCPSDLAAWTTPRAQTTATIASSRISVPTTTTTTTTTAATTKTTDSTAAETTPTWKENADCPFTVGLPSDDCCGVDASGGNRIVGGSETGLDEYPWLALVEYHRELVYPERVVTKVALSCGGSLISSRYVLTAAHCINPSWEKPVNVRLGEYNTTTPEDCVPSDGGGFDCSTVVIVPILRSVIHPDYRPDDPNKAHDIGLFQLRYNAPYTDFIRPICLPTCDVTAPAEPEPHLVVAGWGSDGRRFSDVKRHVRLPLVPLASCRQRYGANKGALRLTDKQLCAGGERGKDSCRGDSGGPLMTVSSGSYILVGVVSSGPRECGTEGTPGVYTSVFHYRDWVRDNLQP